MKCIRLSLALLLAATGLVLGEPVVTWASDPVGPDETVLLRGGGFGASPVVEFARLNDGDPASSSPAAPTWVKLPVLQPSDDALKFIIPADTKPGVFACRVVADGVESQPVLLNRPDVWWLQGDAGPVATPGGWLRLMGKCLGPEEKSVRVELAAASGISYVMPVAAADGWSLRCDVPAALSPGDYKVRVHNGHGGAGAWAEAGPITIAAPQPWPTTVYNVLETCGPDAERQMRDSLVKYKPPIDRTAGVLDAMAKAKANGGGVVYFPAGRYQLNQPLELPPHTLLKGEGMGIVTISWGNTRFYGGGSNQAGATEVEPEPAAFQIGGPAFGVEDMSIYLPSDYKTGIEAAGEAKLRRVRLRVDQLSSQGTARSPKAVVVQLSSNFEVSDCDIITDGTGLCCGTYGVMARNRILAGKCPISLGGARAVIVEDNQFVSTTPGAYINIAGVGQDIYYARNRHEAQDAHQADFSFTFDRGASAYRGTLASVEGFKLTLAADPHYLKWADEHSNLWQRAVVCVVNGKGCTQWRPVDSFSGREWTLAQPFAVSPDANSVVSIVPLCGRILIIGNHFEDACWVDAGYGTTLDVIFAENQLVRCAQMLDYGKAWPDRVLPNFNVQFFDNTLSEGSTSIVAGAPEPKSGVFDGFVTQNIIHRRDHLTADNCGKIKINAGVREAIVEDCSAAHPDSEIEVAQPASGVLVRHCRSSTGDLHCEGTAQVP